MVAQTIEEALAALDPSEYLLELDNKQRAVYARLADAEAEYLKAFEKLGASVVRPPAKKTERVRHPLHRRALVVVPPDVGMPSTVELGQRVADWRTVVQEAAHEQRKADTIGTRGATLPVWLGPVDTLFTEPRPSYVAKKITTHLQRAYRGAKLSPEAAQEMLRKRLGKLQLALQYSLAHKKKDRIDRQLKLEDALMGSLEQLSEYIKHRRTDIESVRMYSGDSWRIYIRHSPGAVGVINTTIATIGLVPGDSGTVIVPCSESIQHPNPLNDIVTLPGGVEVVIRRT
jgi:hypothetical protein